MAPRSSVSRPCRSRVPLAAASAVLAFASAPAAAQTQIWIEQVGSAFADTCFVAPDAAGGVFAGGTASDALGGPSLGSLDAWLGRWDATGQLLWLSQIGTPDIDGMLDLAPDGAGGAFLGGYTSGAIGGANAGLYDAWMERRDASNATLWVRQIGTLADDVVSAVAGDGASGAVFAGSTVGPLGGSHSGLIYSDVWAARYDGAGNQLWIGQFGSAEREEVYGMCADGQGGAIVAGETWGDLYGSAHGGVDAFVARFDALGAVAWILQLGTHGSDSARGVTSDGAGGVLVCGSTTRGLFGPPQGKTDAWCARIDGGGNLVWGRQFGTAQDDVAQDLSADGLGGANVTGSTSGALAGPLKGPNDAWLGLLEPDGELAFLHQFGSNSVDLGASIATVGESDVYVGGTTLGDFGGPSAGGNDAWFARWDVPCSTGQVYCVASATSIAGCKPSIAASGSPSLSAPTGFELTSGAIPGGNPGIAIFGTGGSLSLPIGTLGGVLCFAPPLYRTPPANSGGNVGACDGALEATLADLVQAGPALAPGSSVRVQFWGRDPANADGYLLSDALLFTLCP